MKLAAALFTFALMLSGAAYAEARPDAAIDKHVTQVEVDAARAEAEAKAARYERARALAEREELLGGEGTTDAIRDLVGRREALRGVLAELSRLLDPESPTMRELLAQADQLEALLRAELARLLASLRVEMETAQAHVAELERGLAAEED